MGLVSQFLNITKTSVINTEPLNIKSGRDALLVHSVFFIFGLKKQITILLPSAYWLTRMTSNILLNIAAISIIRLRKNKMVQ
jgi:hypothetical protein